LGSIGGGFAFCIVVQYKVLVLRGIYRKGVIGYYYSGGKSLLYTGMAKILVSVGICG